MQMFWAKMELLCGLIILGACSLDYTLDEQYDEIISQLRELQWVKKIAISKLASGQSIPRIGI